MIRLSVGKHPQDGAKSGKTCGLVFPPAAGPANIGDRDEHESTAIAALSPLASDGWISLGRAAICGSEIDGPILVHEIAPLTTVRVCCWTCIDGIVQNRAVLILYHLDDPISIAATPCQRI